MATDLGKAYVQIVPSAKGIGGSISNALNGESTSAGKSAGLNIAGAIKGAIAAAGIGAALKSALSAGGDLQQSFGGLDTIYDSASDSMKKFAAEAASAGISANDYAEQAVSFGASLKQAFGKDIQGAANAANMAIMDMADNSAKMGTDITSIQTAYQGFAKQNYTMLDNLKLGYGGTKSEMERLLKDASKLETAMGKTFDINNLGDVYEAIHLIQGELGLTGVAADEAKTTFTGSLGAMKASVTNLLANLTLGEDIRPAFASLGLAVDTFLFDNLFPMIGNAFKALPDLLSGVGSSLIMMLNGISRKSSEIAKIGVDIVLSLVKAIVEAAPYLLESATKIVLELGKALISMDWISIGKDLIQSLSDSMDLAAGEIFGVDSASEILGGLLDSITAILPEMLNEGVEIVTNISNGVIQAIPKLLTVFRDLLPQITGFVQDNLPVIYSAGVEILTNLVNGILETLPEIITLAGDIVTQFVTFIISQLPTILDAGVQMLLNLVNGIVNNLPEIVSSVAKVVAKFIATIAQNFPQILQKGVEIIVKLVAGIIQAIPKVVAAIPQIINSIKNAFSSYDWASIGRNLIEGIKNGISSAAGAIANAAREAAASALNAAKNFLGIHSPSTKGMWLGDMYDEGIALGITENMDEVTRATDELMDNTFGEINPMMDYQLETKAPEQSGNLTINMTINGAEGQDINALADLIQEKITNAVNRRELVYA